ncbi:7149_t:CDS:2 [Funneliformis geosporum]|nr:7149_t:CDS:2 [Funneliformis geosporum]
MDIRANARQQRAKAFKIIKALLFRSRTSANSSNSYDCVSISQVRTRVLSRKRAEMGNWSLIVVRSSSGQKSFIDT